MPRQGLSFQLLPLWLRRRMEQLEVLLPPLNLSNYPMSNLSVLLEKSRTFANTNCFNKGRAMMRTLHILFDLLGC